MAEHLFKKLLADAGVSGVSVRSAGISPAHWLGLPKEAEDALARQGVAGLHHSPKGLDERLLNESDLVLVMEPLHREAILARFPHAGSKVWVIKEFAGMVGTGEGIKDPFGGTAEAYGKALDEIKEALERIIKKMRAGGQARH